MAEDASAEKIVRFHVLALGSEGSETRNDV